MFAPLLSKIIVLTGKKNLFSHVNKPAVKKFFRLRLNCCLFLKNFLQSLDLSNAMCYNFKQNNAFLLIFTAHAYHKINILWYFYMMRFKRSICL
ncbi:MAG: hypothetical protein DBX41_00750 [Clostridiales bacterium]|nr:MAG: hypothetical protein DBX41_00750 [Clostridiales bacterium]